MLSIYIDGACEPFNPGGTASYGLVVKAQTGLVLHGEAKIVGSGSGISNNVAEYSALIASIEWHMENCSTETVCIMSDSLMLVNQMNAIPTLSTKGAETYRGTQTGRQIQLQMDSP